MHSLHGLYAITDHQEHPESLLSEVETALQHGAKIVQYRDKSNDQSKRLKEALALVKLTHSYSVPLIINDDIALAKQVRADGVHIGKDDSNLSLARHQLGSEAIIGVSCYNDLSLAKLAAEGGANYIAFGRFFSSSTKPNAVQATPELLQTARQQLALPVVAIGGITPDNGRLLIESGADMLAVIHGLFGQPDIAAAANQYATLFQYAESFCR